MVILQHKKLRRTKLTHQGLQLNNLINTILIRQY